MLPLYRDTSLTFMITILNPHILGKVFYKLIICIKTIWTALGRWRDIYHYEICEDQYCLLKLGKIFGSYYCGFCVALSTFRTSWWKPICFYFCVFIFLWMAYGRTVFHAIWIRNAEWVRKQSFEAPTVVFWVYLYMVEEDIPIVFCNNDFGYNFTNYLQSQNWRNIYIFKFWFESFVFECNIVSEWIVYCRLVF